MHIKKIIRTLFSPTTIKIVALIGIVWFFFILPTYAEWTSSVDPVLSKIKEALHILLSLFSRLWIILAILAGKLMTNDFVYGSFIHMDVYLRKIRNIMKNFANFALAWLVLISIIQGIVGKETLDIKKIITNTLLAGILIQSSWFLMGALIDISTVATASVSAFPMTFLQNDIKLQNKITEGMKWFSSQRIVINPDATGWNNSLFTKEEGSPVTDATREKILPNQNSVSWPFIYLGMSVFSFQKYLTPDITTTAENITLGFALQFFLLFFFTVGLLLLLVANILRVGLLWVFIVWAPFLILFQVFNKKISAGEWWIGKLLTVSNLIAIVFKPLIFVAGISLMLIVIVSMQNSISWSWASWENDLNGVSLSVTWDTSTLSVPWISNVSINQKDILGKDVIGSVWGKAQNFFSTMIMYLLTIFLIRFFIKLSLTTWWWPIEKIMEGLVKQAEDFAKAVPVLPFQWTGISYKGLKSFSQKQRDKTLEWFGLNREWEFIDAENAFKTKVNQWMWMQDPWLPKDRKELELLATSSDSANYSNFFSRSVELAKAREGWLSIADSQWKNSVQTWLSNTKFNEFNSWLPSADQFTDKFGTTKDETIDTYFTKNEGQNAKALYKLMWQQTAAPGSTEPKNYASLAKIRFYPGEE